MPRKPKTKAELEEALKDANAAVAKLTAQVAKLTSDLELAKHRNPPPSEPPKTLAEIPPPPQDALEANKWAHNAMLFALHDVATDKTINARERRKEMRTIAAAIAKLTPTAEIQEGVEIVRRSREEIERKRSRGATLEPRPKRKPDG